MIDQLTQFFMGMSVMLSLMLTCTVLVLGIVWVFSWIALLVRNMGDRPRRPRSVKPTQLHPYVMRGEELDETR